MDKMTSGIIYTIKNKGYSREEIAKFMHLYTDTPVDYYTDSMIDSIMEKTMVEAVRSNEKPASIVYDYFYWRNDPWNYSNFDAICAALSNIQVRKENLITGMLEYINGFYPMEDFNNKYFE